MRVELYQPIWIEWIFSGVEWSSITVPLHPIPAEFGLARHNKLATVRGVDRDFTTAQSLLDDVCFVLWPVVFRLEINRIMELPGKPHFMSHGIPDVVYSEAHPLSGRALSEMGNGLSQGRVIIDSTEEMSLPAKIRPQFERRLDLSCGPQMQLWNARICAEEAILKCLDDFSRDLEMPSNGEWST